ncbi:hypothetical protein [Candidatus Symbiobacter mobilis]|uniref:Uncharacterized protein n=1 Tax=Candidatus Symbiobacter mobilis CR TaxID=946483 RepID=U5NDS0_9BURK|nr:hypothetical protein [Candidatus Symbiobacter mobilis]AGX88309.1 hypothetical protein Cenrod_2244 [Candidatus Symbiobacter mobilis CR]
MERILESQTIEGEIGLVIEYKPGKSEAIQVLAGAMQLIDAMDKLDHCLLSSIDSSLEPVSILNDVAHSSLKIILARALRGVPDEHLSSLEWKKWLGSLLVHGKHLLLQKLDADAPEISRTLDQLEPQYRDAPVGLVGYQPPRVSEVQTALDGVRQARVALPQVGVTVQTELGDIVMEEQAQESPVADPTPHSVRTNTGVEFFKIKSTDMLGQSQWQVMRNGKTIKVSMLHRTWLEQYQKRQHQILPGDSLECRYEETVTYDTDQNEMERSLAIVEVLRILSPPAQTSLPM